MRNVLGQGVPLILAESSAHLVDGNSGVGVIDLDVHGILIIADTVSHGLKMKVQKIYSDLTYFRKRREFEPADVDGVDGFGVVRVVEVHPFHVGSVVAVRCEGTARPLAILANPDELPAALSARVGVDAFADHGSIQSQTLLLIRGDVRREELFWNFHGKGAD